MFNMWINEFMKKIFLLIASCLIVLVFVELALRIFPSLTSKYRFEMYKSSNPIIGVLNMSKYFPKIQASPLLGYERIPLSEPGVNSLGLIGRELELKKPENVYRILVLGDSITECDWWVRYLEASLNNDSRLRYRFEVYNAGVAGYGVSQYAKFFKSLAIRLNPDMVVIGFCLNDLNDTGSMVIYKDDKGMVGYRYSGYLLPNIWPISDFLFKHSYFYRFFYTSVDRLLVKLTASKFISENDRIALFYLEQIKNISDKRKIPLLGIVFPYLKPLETYSEFERGEYNKTNRLLDKLKIDYIDLHKFFPSDAKSLENLRLWDGDVIHPSKEGHKIAGRQFYEYLMRKAIWE